MFRIGCTVKIYDIGPLAVCTWVGDVVIEIELLGERMTIPTRICEVIE